MLIRMIIQSTFRKDTLIQVKPQPPFAFPPTV